MTIVIETAIVPAQESKLYPVAMVHACAEGRSGTPTVTDAAVFDNLIQVDPPVEFRLHYALNGSFES